ncbi:MAG TPA: hypothetical protein ENK18_16040 [Deltaproteobacteria bacterium]|nr:hypothetical protein [Deltaproteobacteria bacterium]
MFGTLRTGDVPALLLAALRDQLGAAQAMVLVPEGTRWRLCCVDAASQPPGLTIERLRSSTKRIAETLNPSLGVSRAEQLPLLGQPLFSRNRLRGVLWLIRRSGERPFSVLDVARLALPAATLSIALDNLAMARELQHAELQAERRRIAWAYTRHHLQLLTKQALPGAVLERLGFALDGLERVDQLEGELP